jgi:hypothetical protein
VLFFRGWSSVCNIYPLLPPQYCHQFTPGCYLNATHFFHFFGSKVLWHIRCICLTVPHQLMLLFIRSSHKSGEENKFSVYNLWVCPTFLVSSVTVTCCSEVLCHDLASLHQVHLSVSSGAVSWSVFMLKWFCFWGMYLKMPFLGREQWPFVLTDVFTSYNHILSQIFVHWFIK